METPKKILNGGENADTTKGWFIPFPETVSGVNPRLQLRFCMVRGQPCPCLGTGGPKNTCSCRARAQGEGVWGAQTPTDKQQAQ